MTKKRGLGRGLGALIPESAGQWDEKAPEAGLRQVPISEIVPNPHQPRSLIDESELAELAASIAEHGVIQPLIVTQTDAQFQLIAGERRWRAAGQAGLEHVPVIIKEVTPQEMLELALVENIQRNDLNALEEATAFRQLIDEFGLTQDQVAERVGKSRSAVANIVRLLTLPEPAQAALLDGRISEGHGRALLGLSTAEAQIAALQTVLKRELSVRQTEELVRRLRGEVLERKPVRPVDQEIGAVEERLRQRLGTKVELRHGKKGGRIVIHYYSDEELQSLLDEIAGE